MEKDSRLGRRDFLKLGGLAAISLATQGIITPKNSEAGLFNYPLDITFNSCDFQKMSSTQKLDFADRLGEGVMTDTIKIHDFWLHPEYDYVLDQRVMRPKGIKIRPETGEAELRYDDHEGCFPIYAFASRFSESLIKFGEEYLVQGKAEKDKKEIIISGNNYDFIKEGGQIINKELDWVPDKDKLAAYLHESYFNNKDPLHQKLGGEFAYRILKEIESDGKYKDIRVVIEPNERENMELHYPVTLTSMTKNLETYKSLVNFPRDEDERAMNDYAASEQIKKKKAIGGLLGLCTVCHHHQ